MLENFPCGIFLHNFIVYCTKAFIPNHDAIDDAKMEIWFVQNFVSTKATRTSGNDSLNCEQCNDEVKQILALCNFDESSKINEEGKYWTGKI